MKEEHLELAEDIVIVGIAVKTSLATAAKDIPAVWKRFMEEGFAARLPRKADDAAIYAVYCDYERDFAGPYTMVLGVAADAGASVPSGMRRVRLPNGRYARFAVEGDPSQIVWQAWTHINSAWAERTKRRYIADYERYPLDSLTERFVKADVVVGLE